MVDSGIGMKECPKCAERVRETAKVCRYCGHRFKDTRAQVITIGALGFGLLAMLAMCSRSSPDAPSAFPTSAQTFTAQAQGQRKAKCEDSMKLAERTGFVTRYRSPMSIEVDDTMWPQLPWAQKEVLLSCLAIIDADGGDMGTRLVSAYGSRSGKQLAAGSPGRGVLAPSD